MNTRSTLLVSAVLLAACSGSDDGSKAGSTVAPEILFLLQKGDGSLSVYGNKLYEVQNHARCNFMGGQLTDSELANIKGYLKDGSLKLGEKECSEGQFSLLLGSHVRNNKACWDEPEGTAPKAITQLFTDHMTQLDKMPMGVCNVNPPGLHVGPIKSQPPPPTRNAAGSGG